MRLIKSILIIALLLSCRLAFAKQSPKELLDSLPDQIGSFRADEATITDKNAYRKYRAKDIHINVELLEVAAALRDDVDSEELQEIRQVHLNNAKDTTIKVGSDRAKEIDLGGGKKIELLFIRLLSSDYSKVLADLYLTGIKGYVCKIWVTRFGLLAGQKEKNIDEALRVIFSELAK